MSVNFRFYLPKNFRKAAAADSLSSRAGSDALDRVLGSFARGTACLLGRRFAASTSVSQPTPGQSRWSKYRQLEIREDAERPRRGEAS